MQKFGYGAASILRLFAGMWILDIRIHGLRLLAGGAPVTIFLSFWDSADSPSRLGYGPWGSWWGYDGAV